MSTASYTEKALGILSRCISREEGLHLLREIHEGECSAHSSYRTLVGKAFRMGYYWPSVSSDAREHIAKCQTCQFHARQQHLCSYSLQTIPVVWPFSTWGLDAL